MGGGVRGEDKEIAHIDDKPSLSDHIPEVIIHKSLKGGRKVGESEEHNGGFEEAFMGNESCFPFVTIFDLDVVVFPMYSMSNLVKILASFSLSMRLEIRGRG